jgi:hypothetical protein
MRVTSLGKVEKPRENRDSRFQNQDSEIYQAILNALPMQLFEDLSSDTNELPMQIRKSRWI